jgi:hypothetical protein
MSPRNKGCLVPAVYLRPYASSLPLPEYGRRQGENFQKAASFLSSELGVAGTMRLFNRKEELARTKCNTFVVKRLLKTKKPPTSWMRYSGGVKDFF